MKARLKYGIVAAVTIIVAVLSSADILPGSCVRTKTHIVGIVNVNAGLLDVTRGFKAYMSESGFIEDRDIVYLDKGVLDIDEVDAAVQELVGKSVDLILAITTPVAQQAATAVQGTNIPVVFAPVFYPFEAGLVKSLTHPGGNLTGVQAGGSTEKALDLHALAFPRTKRIFAPVLPGDEAAAQCLSDLKRAAGKLNIAVEVREVRTRNELKTALADVPRRMDALWLLNSHFLVSNTQLFVAAAIRHRLPLSSGTSQYKRGVMLSYGQDPLRTGQQAGRMARAILMGTSPGDIPVETTDFLLGINLRTARACGFKIPDAVLQQSNSIIR